MLQFPYRDCVVNLLDTPGHRDFSEDTYRVLAAADAAVMVLDAAKGIEPQTLKLFEVCRARGLPLLTFINKWDRPGRDPLELLDEIEAQIGVTPSPITWPVGIAGDFRGVIDRRRDEFVRFTRVARGATEAPEEIVPPERAAGEEGAAWTQAIEELDLLDGVGAGLRRGAVPRRRAVADLLRVGAHELRCAAAARRVHRPRSRRPAPARTRTASRGPSMRRSRASCSRSRRTWTGRTATASPTCGCALAGSSGAWS